MKKIHPGLVLAIFLSTLFFVESQAYSSDASVMFALKNSLNPLEVLGWSDPDPCYWSHVSCTAYKRVAWIQIGGLNLTGSLPDLSGLTSLVYFNIRDNKLAGLVPLSLLSLPSLKIVNMTNNLLQGPTPKFADSVAVDMKNGSNRFCLPTPGDECDPRVSTFLSIARSVDYPTLLADAWKGNDPCSSFWVGITCVGGNVTVINLSKMGLSGTISPDFSSFKSLKMLVLANNNLTGVIPKILTTLPMLRELDLSNNQLSGKVPRFRSNVKVNVNGNPNVGKDKGNSTSVAMSTTDSPVPSTDKIQELAVIPRM